MEKVERTNQQSKEFIDVREVEIPRKDQRPRLQRPPETKG